MRWLGVATLLALGCSPAEQGIVQRSCGPTDGSAMALIFDRPNPTCGKTTSTQSLFVESGTEMVSGAFPNDLDSNAFACRNCGTMRDDAVGQFVIRIDTSTAAELEGHLTVTFKSGSKVDTDFKATVCSEIPNC